MNITSLIREALHQATDPPTTPPPLTVSDKPLLDSHGKNALSEDLDARLEAGDLFEHIATLGGEASRLAKRWLMKWT